MTYPLVLGFKQIERIVIEQKKAHEMFYKAGHFGASGMVGGKIFYGCYGDWKVDPGRRWVPRGDGSQGDSGGGFNG